MCRWNKYLEEETLLGSSRQFDRDLGGLAPQRHAIVSPRNTPGLREWKRCEGAQISKSLSRHLGKLNIKQYLL
jgi:hypothetical protein